MYHWVTIGLFLQWIFFYFPFLLHHMAKLVPVYYKTQNIFLNLKFDNQNWYFRFIWTKGDNSKECESRLCQHWSLTLEWFYAFFVDLIDDIGDHMDQTKERLVKETRHIRIVDRKSATCGTLIISFYPHLVVYTSTIYMLLS